MLHCVNLICTSICQYIYIMFCKHLICLPMTPTDGKCGLAQTLKCGLLLKKNAEKMKIPMCKELAMEKDGNVVCREKYHRCKGRWISLGIAKNIVRCIEGAIGLGDECFQCLCRRFVNQHDVPAALCDENRRGSSEEK